MDHPHNHIKMEHPHAQIKMEHQHHHQYNNGYAIRSPQQHMQHNHNNIQIHTCEGCRGPILERFLLEVCHRYYHHMCLKCMECGTTLADVGNTCFSKEGMILCKNDYIRLFGLRGACNGCGQQIPADEFVMRAGGPLGSSPRLVFHVNCFTCSKCMKTLSTGDRYSVLNGALFCEQDALKLMKQNGIGSPSNANVATSNGPTTAPRKGKVGRPRRSRD